MPLEYTGYNWPKKFTLTFTLPELTEADLPYYFTGNDTFAIKPDPSVEFYVKRIILNGEYSAAGSAVQLKAAIHKGSVDDANIGISATTAAESDADPVFRQSNTPTNTDTGMDKIDNSSGYIGVITLAGGDTFTLVNGAVIILECEYL